MKDMFKNMLEHPFATWFVVGVMTSGIVSVVNSFKNVVTINVTSKKNESN